MDRKMCCVFTEVSTWFYFADRRNTMFKICTESPCLCLDEELCVVSGQEMWSRMLQSQWRSSDATITFVDPHAFPRIQAGFSDLNSSQGNLIAFYGEKKSIERSLCPSSRDRQGRQEKNTSYTQVKDIHSAFIPDFSHTWKFRKFSWAQRGWTVT